MSTAETDNDSSVAASDGWERHWSKSHKAYYWHNKLDNRTTWALPSADNKKISSKSNKNEDERPNKRRAVEGSSGITSSAPSITKPKVGIIVPFRDLHAEQMRHQHLKAFIPHMTAFLEAADCPFHIYVIEQSSDGRKFNRGKLLNIGFETACRDNCKIFILHDVDLLPSTELAPAYTEIPSQPVHIARVWGRYNDNPKYFGGIVAFTEDQYRRINGYPNTFWGWGGEDDEMYNRLQEVGLSPTAPSAGSIVDLEGMSLANKLSMLKNHPKWKCMNKTEMLAEHGEWKSNGLSSLTHTELKRTVMSAHCTRVAVDVNENKHWSDLVCGLEDAQFDCTVEELKAAFAARSGGRGR